MRHKVAIVFEEDYLGSYPSLIESIKMLSEKGFQVDILGTSRKTLFPKPPRFNKNVNFFSLKLNTEISRDYPIQSDVIPDIQEKEIVNPLSIKRFLPNTIKRLIRKQLNIFKENFNRYKEQKEFLINQFIFLIFICNLLRKNKYHTVIGIDQVGGSLSYLCTRIIPCDSFIYWGLEITELNQSLWCYSLYKQIECIATTKANVIITTDKLRAHDICKENNLLFKSCHFIYVPHSPLGYCEIKNSNFFQDKFSLNDNICTILHCGWIHDVMLSKDLAAISRNWPETWRLIFHERMKRREDEPYIQKVRKAGDHKLLLSLEPVNYDEIDNVIISSNIGIVIYDNSNQWGVSWLNIAKASGKLAHYLRCGKPVVCSNLPGFREIIEEYQCGVLFDTPDQILAGIEKILKNYDFYKQNAYRCYDYEYEFSRYFTKLIIFIKNSIFYKIPTFINMSTTSNYINILSIFTD